MSHAWPPTDSPLLHPLHHPSTPALQEARDLPQTVHGRRQHIGPRTVVHTNKANSNSSPTVRLFKPHAVVKTNHQTLKRGIGVRM